MTDYHDDVIGLAAVEQQDQPWPSQLDPAVWVRCRKRSGAFCTGVLHVECRPEGFVMPESYR